MSLCPRGTGDELFFLRSYAETSAMLDNFAAIQKYRSAMKPESPVGIICRGQLSSNVSGKKNDIPGQDDKWALLHADLANRLNVIQIVAEKYVRHLQLSDAKLVFKIILSFI